MYPKDIPVVTFDTGIADAPEGSIACEVCTDNAQAGSVAAENMYNAIKDVVANAEGQVIIGEVNQDATAQNIQQRGGGFIDKMIELLQADGKTVAVAGNEFYVNAAKNADATEADADVVIQVAVPAQTTVELCSNEAQAILSKENCIAIFGSNQTAAEGVLAANANLNVLGSDAANRRRYRCWFRCWFYHQSSCSGRNIPWCSYTVSSDDGLLCNLRSDSSS